jgi:hypothetical protein
MGAESTVRAKVNGKADQGKALLETNEVVFRGAQRCVVKLDPKTRAGARAKGSWLSVGPLQLELGARAAQWLQKIQNPKSVLEKLGVKPGQTVALINVRDESFAAKLPRGDSPDVIFFEVTGPADLKRLPELRKRLPDDGALWLLRPKGKDAPVGERETMAAGKAAGLVDVKVVGFSETLSAEKYVVPVASRKPK